MQHPRKHGQSVISLIRSLEKGQALLLSSCFGWRPMTGLSAGVIGTIFLSHKADASALRQINSGHDNHGTTCLALGQHECRSNCPSA
jgi:hypothetical protein